MKICYHKENPYASFSLRKILILALWLVPWQLLTATIPLPPLCWIWISIRSSESFWQARPRDKHSLFPIGFVFSVFGTEMMSNTPEGGDMQLEQGRRSGWQHPAVRSVLPGILQSVYYIPTIWNSSLGSSFVLQHGEVSSSWSTLVDEKRYSSIPHGLLS